MKRTVLALAGCMCVLAGVAWAEDTPAEPAGWAGGAVVVGAAKPLVMPRLGWQYGQMEKVCDLSDKQVQQIADILDAQKKATKDFYAENADKIKAVRKDMQEAYRSKDKTAIAQAQADSRELYAPLTDLSKKCHEDVMAVLTPAQKAKWQEHQVIRSVKMRFWAAKLTDEQLGKIKQVYAGLAKDDKAPQADIIRKLCDQTKEMLTDEQKEVLAKQRSGWLIRGQGGAAKPLPGSPAGGAASDLKPGRAVIIINGKQVQPADGVIIIREDKENEGKEAKNNDKD